MSISHNIPTTQQLQTAQRQPIRRDRRRQTEPHSRSTRVNAVDAAAQEPATKVQGAAAAATVTAKAGTAKAANTPPSDVLIRNLALIAVETVSGTRSLSQIRSHITAAAYRTLQTQLALAHRVNSSSTMPDRCVSTVTSRVFATRLSDDIYEAVVTVQQQLRNKQTHDSGPPCNSRSASGRAGAKTLKPPDNCQHGHDSTPPTVKHTSAGSRTSVNRPDGVRNIAVVLRLERFRSGWRASELYVL